jgi:hypothetical protein
MDEHEYAAYLIESHIAPLKARAAELGIVITEIEMPHPQITGAIVPEHFYVYDQLAGIRIKK